MNRFLFFDKMITPAIINVAYWIAILAFIIGAISYMFSGGFGRFLYGIVVLVAGLIAIRVVAELIMVIFKANAALQKLAGNDDDSIDQEVGGMIDNFFDNVKEKASQAKGKVSEAKDKIKTKQAAKNAAADTVENVTEEVADSTKA